MSELNLLGTQVELGERADLRVMQVQQALQDFVSHGAPPPLEALRELPRYALSRVFAGGYKDRQGNEVRFEQWYESLKKVADEELSRLLDYYARVRRRLAQCSKAELSRRVVFAWRPMGDLSFDSDATRLSNLAVYVLHFEQVGTTWRMVMRLYGASCDRQGVVTIGTAERNLLSKHVGQLPTRQGENCWMGLNADDLLITLYEMVEALASSIESMRLRRRLLLAAESHQTTPEVLENPQAQELLPHLPWGDLRRLQLAATANEATFATVDGPPLPDVWFGLSADNPAVQRLLADPATMRCVLSRRQYPLLRFVRHSDLLSHAPEAVASSVLQLADLTDLLGLAGRYQYDLAQEGGTKRYEGRRCQLALQGQEAVYDLLGARGESVLRLSEREAPRIRRRLVPMVWDTASSQGIQPEHLQIDAADAGLKLDLWSRKW